MDLALNYFQKATEKAPRFPELYLDLGDAYSACGKMVQAIDAYEEVSRILPDSSISDQARAKASLLKKKRLR
jgi:tetratricopeptide (TPR) repeat protein